MRFLGGKSKKHYSRANNKSRKSKKTKVFRKKSKSLKRKSRKLKGGS
tara:strand:+ start:1170 stop:1310 length:141 start_codon:yes stop_codon:yes gene_type:complete